MQRLWACVESFLFFIGKEFADKGETKRIFIGKMIARKDETKTQSLSMYVAFVCTTTTARFSDRETQRWRTLSVLVICNLVAGSTFVLSQRSG